MARTSAGRAGRMRSCSDVTGTRYPRPRPDPRPARDPVRRDSNDVDRLELTFSIPELPPFPAPVARSVDVAVEDGEQVRRAPGGGAPGPAARPRRAAGSR
ncbi:hypothetical protein CBZ_14260 [Cellulomonas biazotea]|uniref:Uncharacterized protein n=1 Tax=Cellulomonas biazotea TaxID=1709 RepID=A0A402DQF6_9CELL|nr:hypothetical protein CBZ_14260 [Cellulomonas biazotea]